MTPSSQPSASASGAVGSERLRALVDLGQSALVERSLHALLEQAYEHVVGVDGFAGVAVFDATPDGTFVFRSGQRWTGPERGDADVLSASGAVVPLPGTEPQLTMVALAGPNGVTAECRQFLNAVAATLGAAAARLVAEEQLTSSQQRLMLAQRIAHMGSYDWHIASDTNTWSDELYRIYGTEPQSFNASYERFLSFIHPDDREMIMGVHQRALETGQPYQMEERIIRPDGEHRILASNGEVITDDEGRPVRMVGICFDVTELKRASEETARNAHRFEALVESAPDAVLLVDTNGSIVQVNEQAEELFGYARDELEGMRIEELVPLASTEAHRAHRAEFLRDPTPRQMGVRLDIRARRKDGAEVPVDVSLGVIDTGDGVAIAAFVRDATPRRRAESDARRLYEIEQGRRQALEINDNVVQGLATVVYALEAEQNELARASAQRTLGAARTMMSDLLTRDSRGALTAGDLVREAPASAAAPPAVVEPTDVQKDGIRVLIADDSDDMRLMVRMTLRSEGLDIVGEAADGRAVLEQLEQSRPDVLLLDLAMPEMDGLEVIPHVRERSPNTKIVVLSGFDEGRMAATVLERGAHAYMEKGKALADLLPLIRSLVPGRPVAPRAKELEQEHLSLDTLGASHLTHELRTPTAVIQGLVGALRRGVDRLPSKAVTEILEALDRNADQLMRLLEDVREATLSEDGVSTLRTQPTDLRSLVEDIVADMRELLAEHEVVIVGDAVPHAEVDPWRVRQVIVNLLSNAAKFSPPGSRITITPRHAGDAVEIEVADTGPGVPAARRGELFREFSRLGSEKRGLGLGLYLSRKIARAHGGDVDLVPSDGPGATFLLRLPVNAHVAH